MPNKHGPGCTCCGGVECQFFSDNFTRADDNDPGEYTEVAGDWDISSNTLITNGGSGLLIADTEHPTSEPNIRVNVTVTNDSATSTRFTRIILDYTDSNNYWFAQVRSGNTTPTLTIVERSGGTNTTRATLSLAQPDITFNFCASIFQATTFSARITDSGQDDAITFDSTFTEPAWGLADANSGGVVTVFDDLTAAAVSDACPSCGQECEHCTSGEAPAELKVVIPSGTWFTDSAETPSHCGTTPDCTVLEGTFYLPSRRCVRYSSALGNIDIGKCAVSPSCAYALHIDGLDCPTGSPGNSLLDFIGAEIFDDGSGGGMGGRVSVIVSVGAHIIDGVSYAGGLIYTTRFTSGLKAHPFDCDSLQDEQCDWALGSFGSTAATDNACRPLIDSHVEVTAISG